MTPTDVVQHVALFFIMLALLFQMKLNAHRRRMHDMIGQALEHHTQSIRDLTAWMQDLEKKISD